jgi:anti-sigma factor RsiW
MTPTRHLTEDERQGIADGSLDSEQLRDAYEHLAACRACDTDVASLRILMTRIHHRAPPATDTSGVAELWPEILTRIERSKLVDLPSMQSPLRSRPAILRRRGIIGLLTAAMAAGLLVAALVVRRPAISAPQAAAIDTGAAFINVVDSTRAYEAEANTLLNELEMQRALLRPSTGAAIDRDLQVIDRSIAELKAALTRDPANPALRRLLASTYRQKVELLQRANNAG